MGCRLHAGRGDRRDLRRVVQYRGQLPGVEIQLVLCEIDAGEAGSPVPRAASPTGGPGAGMIVGGRAAGMIAGKNVAPLRRPRRF